jgi:hypothetical protein
VVSADIPSRILTVRISDLASGYQKLQWEEAWRALKSAEENGWRNTVPTLWADTADSRRVAFATSATIFGAGCCVSLSRLACRLFSS